MWCVYGGRGVSLHLLSPTPFFYWFESSDVMSLILHLGISLMNDSLVPAPVATAALQGPGFLSLSLWTGLDSSVSALLSNRL